jgi:hypothetical protein
MVRRAVVDNVVLGPVKDTVHDVGWALAGAMIKRRLISSTTLRQSAEENLITHFP